MFRLAVPPRSAICAVAVELGVSVSNLLRRNLDGKIIWSPEIAHIRAGWMSPVFVHELVAWAEAWECSVIRGSCALLRLPMELPHVIPAAPALDIKEPRYQLPTPIPKVVEQQHSSQVHRHMGGPARMARKLFKRMHSYQQYRQFQK